MTAGDVRVGHRIEWCGRSGYVWKTEPSRPQRRGRRLRQGVYLTCDIDGVGKRRLHYWADEPVKPL